MDDMLELDDGLDVQYDVNFEIGSDTELLWPSQSLPEAQKAPCLFFDVFGTQDTWQGKRFTLCNSASSSSRGMLQLVQWPVINILRQVMKNNGVPHMYKLAMTCRSLREVALQFIETYAKQQFVKIFQGDTQLGQFVDSFGFFSWALKLRNWLPLASLKNWQKCELDAAYDFLSAQVVINERSNMVGLKPFAAARWKVEGRHALELFCKDCLVCDGNFRRILYHYNKAWRQVRCILESNATAIRLLDLKVHSNFIMRSITFSWPHVSLCVYDPSANIVGASEWSVQEVYNWFRLKRFPVSGLVDLQLDGRELRRLCTIAQTDVNAIKIFLKRAPKGLGMTVKQYAKLEFYVKNGMFNTVPVDQKDITITFRVGEQKSD